MQLGRAAALAAASVLAASCGGGSRPPAPPPAPSTTLAPTTTAARVPTLSGEAIAGVDAPAVHRSLQALGFATAAPRTEPGFVTTTSTRADATVSTYGRDATEVVKIIAEADKAAAAEVLPPVARSPLRGPEARRAETWVRAELKKGAKSPTEPRASKATYGKQPYELLITTTTATLSIGRLSD